MRRWMVVVMGSVAALVVAAVLGGAVGVDNGEAVQWSDAGDVRIGHDTKARALILEVGPVDLPAGADHDEISQPGVATVAFPVGGWLRGFDVEIVDGAGEGIPRPILHHINLIAADRRELFSPIMQRVAAAGADTQPAMLPRFLGYRVEAGAPLMVTTVLHNPTSRAFTGVRVRVRMPLVPETARWKPRDIQPFYLDVMPPAGTHSFDLPPGRSEQSWSGRPAIPGRMLGVGGHLHRHAVSLRLEDVTAGKLLWEGRPVFDETGEVEAVSMKTFYWRLGLPLRTEHVYRLTAIYDNPTGRTIPDGGMGAMGGAFLPARTAQWPALDREDPEYLVDVRTVHGGGHGHGAGGGGHAH